MSACETSEHGVSHEAARDPGRTDPPRGWRTVLAAGLAALAVAVLLPTAALADCQPAIPMSMDAVTCTGNDSTGYVVPGGVTDLVIEIEAGATIDESDGAINAALDLNELNTITNFGTIDATEALGRGVRGTFSNELLNDATGDINVLGVGGIGVDFGDDAFITNDGTVDVIGDGAWGLSGGDRSTVVNNGTITVDGDWTTPTDLDTSAVAIRVGDLPNLTDVNAVTGNAPFVQNTNSIILNGTGSIGIRAGDGWGNFTNALIINAPDSNVFFDPGVDPIPVIQINGDDGVGIWVGLDSSATNGGDIVVGGANAVGMRGEDGSTLINSYYIDGSVVSTVDPLPYTRPGMIAVSGADAIGLQSEGGSVFNIGVIDVTGVGAVGVELGPTGSTATNTNFVNGSDSNSFLPPTRSTELPVIMGGPNAGPLIRIGITGTTPGQYQIQNDSDGSILASPGRIAILGGDGPDFVENIGRIEGLVLLGAGDDSFAVRESPRMPGVAGFSLDGADAGTNDPVDVASDQLGDLLVLSVASPGSAEIVPFDMDLYTGFESLEILGGGRWSLSPSPSLEALTGATFLRTNATLDVGQGIRLGGQYIQEADSFLLGELTSGGGPLLDVAGDIDLAAGSLLFVDDDRTLTDGEMLTLLQAGGALNGTFDDIVFFGAGPRRIFTPTYTADALTVLFTTDTFVGIATTPNRRAIARAFDAIQLAGPSTDIDNVFADLDALPRATVNARLDSFGPEAFDAQSALLLEATRQLSRLLLDRPRECAGDRPDAWRGPDNRLPCQQRKRGPWLALLGGSLDRDREPENFGYDGLFGGVAMGADHHVGDLLTFTAVASAQRGGVDVARSGEGTVTTFDLTGHAALRIGPVRAQALFGYGHGWHDTLRAISIPGFSRRAASDHESDRITAVVDLGAEFDLGRVRIEPVAAFHWTQLMQEEVSESDAADLNLRIEERDDTLLETTVGFRLSTLYHKTEYWADLLEFADGVWRPELEVRWRQIVQGADRDVEARFAGASGTRFEVSGDDGDGGAEIGVGLSFTPSRTSNLDLSIRYETYVSENLTSQSLMGGVRLEF